MSNLSHLMFRHSWWKSKASYLHHDNFALIYITIHSWQFKDVNIYNVISSSSYFKCGNPALRACSLNALSRTDSDPVWFTFKRMITLIVFIFYRCLSKINQTTYQIDAYNTMITYRYFFEVLHKRFHMVCLSQHRLRLILQVRFLRPK